MNNNTNINVNNSNNSNNNNQGMVNNANNMNPPFLDNNQPVNKEPQPINNNQAGTSNSINNQSIYPNTIPNNVINNANPNQTVSPNLNTNNLGTPNQVNNQNVVDQNQNSIKIEETSVTKSQNGTVTVATLNNGSVNVITDKMPEALDISVKPVKTVTKNGKKVRIMTKRELITNIILSFFFVLALCGVGYGTYYYLFRNNPRNFETKNITVEYGDEIPQSVRSYINLTDISEPDYTLDLSGVKTEIGTYTYKVSYGNTTKTGTITINDTTAPLITFNEETSYSEGTTITKDMLVASCEDPSGCTYDLDSQVDTTTVGNTTANITAKDNLGNSKTYTIDLTIYEKLTTYFCTNTVVTVDENSKTLLENNNYTLSFNSQKNLKNGKVNTVRTYLSDSDYTSIKNSLEASGYVLEEINRRAKKESTVDNIANLTTQDEIITHLQSNGYTCTLQEN